MYDPVEWYNNVTQDYSEIWGFVDVVMCFKLALKSEVLNKKVIAFHR